MIEGTTTHMAQGRALPSSLCAGAALLVAAMLVLQAQEAIADAQGPAPQTQAENDKPLRFAALEVSIAMVEADLSKVEEDIHAREKYIVGVSEKLGIKAALPSCEKIRISPQEPRPYYNMGSVYNVSASMQFRIDPPENASRLLEALVRRGYVASLSVEILSPQEVHRDGLQARKTQCG